MQAGETKLNVPAAQVPVTDTIGAGDTIMAALLTQIDERGSTPPRSPNWALQSGRNCFPSPRPLQESPSPGRAPTHRGARK